MPKNEKSIEVLAEGGSSVLYGLRSNNGWLVSRKVIDQTPAMLGEDWIQHQTGVVDFLRRRLS